MIEKIKTKKAMKWSSALCIKLLENMWKIKLME